MSSDADQKQGSQGSAPRYPIEVTYLFELNNAVWMHRRIDSNDTASFAS